MEETNKEIISAIGYFYGLNTKGNFDVQLKIKFYENELINSLQFVSGIGKRIKMILEIEDKNIKIGIFSVYNIKIDRDANSVVTFKSNRTESNTSELSNIFTDECPITVKAKIIND